VKNLDETQANWGKPLSIHTYRSEAAGHGILASHALLGEDGIDKLLRVEFALAASYAIPL